MRANAAAGHLGGGDVEPDLVERGRLEPLLNRTVHRRTGALAVVEVPVELHVVHEVAAQGVGVGTALFGLEELEEAAEARGDAEHADPGAGQPEIGDEQLEDVVGEDEGLGVGEGRVLQQRFLPAAEQMGFVERFGGRRQAAGVENAEERVAQAAAAVGARFEVEENANPGRRRNR